MVAHQSPATIGVYIAVYVAMVIICSIWIACHGHRNVLGRTFWEFKWVPDVFRRELCLRPLYPVMIFLPAILWPVVLAGLLLLMGISGLILALRALFSLDESTTCCGRPIGRHKKDAQALAEADVEAAVIDQQPRPEEQPRPEPQPKPEPQPTKPATATGEAASTASSTLSHSPPAYSP